MTLLKIKKKRYYQAQLSHKGKMSLASHTSTVGKSINILTFHLFQSMSVSRKFNLQHESYHDMFPRAFGFMDDSAFVSHLPRKSSMLF
jgi:hypothetical protein